MTGLNKIIEKIISEAHDRARITVEQARKRCIEISNEYAERRECEKQTLIKEAEDEARVIISQAKTSAEQIQRDALAKARAELVEGVFTSVTEEIKNLPDERYAEIVAHLAETALHELTESQGDNIDGQDIELLLNKKDLDRCGERIYAAFCDRAAREYGKDIEKRIILSEKTASIYGGAMLRCGSVETSASFSKLFEGLREKLYEEIEGYLFGEGKQ